MKTYNVSNSDKTSLFQNDINIAASNAMEVVANFTNNSNFAILSGLDYNGIQYSAGVVIMNGVLRTVPAGATATDYLAPLDEQTDSRVTKGGNVRPVYTTYTVSMSKTDTGFPQLTEDNVAKYRGWINSPELLGEKVVTERALADGSISYGKLDPKISSSLSFDYIVDSDEALAGLINNPNATNVLVKKGTWNYTFTGSTGEIAILLNTATKRIVGEAGSKIAITSNASFFFALGYQNEIDIQLKSKYSIENVEIEVAGPVATSGAFHYCNNLYNCTANVVGAGYNSCANLVNCNVNATSGSDVNAVGFFSCYNMVNCYGLATGTTSFPARGAYDCDYISMSTAYGQGDGGVGFANCSRMSSCVGGGQTHGCLQCRMMFGNLTNSYEQCFMSKAGTTLPVGATAEGGYNYTL